MISCTCSYAQEDVTVTISMNKWKAMEESVKHLNDSITSLNKIIVSKDTLISNREKINEQTFKIQKQNRIKMMEINFGIS